MRTAIIGLPMVGKTALFTILTGVHEHARVGSLEARAGVANHQLGAKQIETLCALDGEGRALLEQAGARLGFSARAYHRIMKVARTIADLDGQERIAPAHVGEAIQYRCLDRRAQWDSQ